MVLLNTSEILENVTWFDLICDMISTYLDSRIIHDNIQINKYLRHYVLLWEKKSAIWGIIIYDVWYIWRENVDMFADG